MPESRAKARTVLGRAARRAVAAAVGVSPVPVVVALALGAGAPLLAQHPAPTHSEQDRQAATDDVSVSLQIVYLGGADGTVGVTPPAKTYSSSAGSVDTTFQAADGTVVTLRPQPAKGSYFDGFQSGSTCGTVNIFGYFQSFGCEVEASLDGAPYTINVGLNFAPCPPAGTYPYGAGGISQGAEVCPGVSIEGAPAAPVQGGVATGDGTGSPQLSGRVTTGFTPGNDGFGFVNDFPTPFDVPRFTFGARTYGPYQLGGGYGLCGGMTFAAADTFHAGAAAKTPRSSTVPTSGQVFDYLWSRQLASLGKSTIPTLLVDGLLSQTALDARSAKAFTSEVKPSIDHGDPVPIVLLESRHSLADDHQVLVTGYFSLGTATVMSIYDPNYPGRARYLNLSSRIESSDPYASNKVGSFKAFFVNENYRAAAPPWAR